MAFLFCAFVMLIRLKEAHKLRRGLVILATTALIAISQMQSSVKIATALIIAASLMSLAPIALNEVDESKIGKINALVAFQVLSYSFLFFSVGNSHFFWFFVTSLVLRIALPFCAPTLVDALVLMPGSQRSLFYLCSLAYGVLIAPWLTPELGIILLIPVFVCIFNAVKAGKSREGLLFTSQAFVFLPLAASLFKDPTLFAITLAVAAVAITLLAQTNLSSLALANANRFELDLKIFETTTRLFHRASRIARQALGPIVMEWLFLRIPAAALVILRLLFRTVSLASMPRVLATSLLLSFIMLVCILRL